MITFLRLVFAVSTVVTTCAEMTAQDFVLRKYATSVERDVVYGTAVGFAGTTDTLRLNYWKPLADGNPRRPLIIWVHGGGFTGGSRTDFDALSEAYAQRGYVAVTISYRLGFHPPAQQANPYAFDSAEVVRAAYRASQDLFGAARFMAARAATDSINPASVIIGGASAGGITVLQAGYIDENERYAATREIAPIPGVVSSPRPDLGLTTGTLNTDVATPRILAVVNIFGGIPDTSFIESADNPALYQYHQTGDPLVACGYAKGLWSYPFGIPDNYYYIHGSCNIKPRVEHLGYSSARHRSWIHDGNIHGFHDPIAIDLDIATFLAPLVRDAVSSVQNNAVQNNDDYAITNTSPGAVQIFDTTGRIVFTDTLLRDGELPALPPGAYIVRIGVETRFFLVLR